MSTANGLHLVLLGAPGAGKGTQAEMLAQRLGVPHISTGGILRDEVRRGSELGMRAKAFMDRGELFPDDLMLGLVTDRLKEPDSALGFLFDGFPRSVPQAIGLESICKQKKTAPTAVSLDVPERELVARLSGRRTCRSCGALVHALFDPPKREGVCNRCSGELYQRDDDREEIIAARLVVYRKATQPVLDFYRQRGQLVDVDGTGPTGEVFSRILGALGRGQ